MEVAKGGKESIEFYLRTMPDPEAKAGKMLESKKKF